MTPAFSEVASSLAPVAETLDALAVPYLICGSLASSMYGVPRFTQDVDLVADLPAGKVDAFVEALRTRFYVDRNAVAEAVRRQRSFNLIHLQSFVKIDVFLAKGDAFTRAQIDRRARRDLPAGTGQSVTVATAEDTVLSKLRWYRDGGSTSEQQWKDVLGVLKVQAQRLDREYLARWARELELTELLAKAIDDSGLSPPV